MFPFFSFYCSLAIYWLLEPSLLLINFNNNLINNNSVNNNLISSSDHKKTGK